MIDENINLPDTENSDPVLPDTADEPEITPLTQPGDAPEVLPCEPAPEAEPPAVSPEMTPCEAVPEVAPAEVTPEVTPSAVPAQAAYITPPAQAPYQPPYAPQPLYAPQPPYTQQPPYAQQSPAQPPYSAPYTPNAPYNTPYTHSTQAPAPKKKSTGAKVMLICLWVLLGLFGLALIGICGYFMGVANADDNNSNNDKNPYHDFWSGIYDSSEPTTPTEIADTTEPADNINLYGEGEVVLNKYPSDKGNSEKYNTQSAYEKVSPSTVGIMCYSDKGREYAEGQGTGIIINTSGYIATNSHVIGDSKNAYYIDVVLSDGNVYEAKVVGFDTRTDLAVIKITADGLVPAEFADSDLVAIGEDVIAIGNPGGLEFQNTLTRGIVSAKDRTLDLSTQVKYIQTDAAINPGNSGGPLCNTCGQVIGINSAKIADSNYEGMGFAIPSRTVKEVVDDLIKQGYVSGRVKIGIIGTAVSAQTSKYTGVPQGIEIAEITEGGPCDNGQVKTGDIIVSLDDYKITSFNDIFTALTNYSEGDEATLTLYRPSDEEYIETVITLQADNGSVN